MGDAAVLVNVRIFHGACDLTGQSNKVELNAEYEALDRTVFGPAGVGSAGWVEVIAGLGSAAPSASGFWAAGNAGKVDDAMWAALGNVGGISIFDETADGLATYGDAVYLQKAMTSQYKIGDAVGQLAPYSFSAASSSPMARGKSLHPPGTARTANGDGTAVEHVAVPSGKRLAACLHMLSVAGTSTPTLTVKVQSDADGSFGSPTDRISFAPATDRTSEFLTADGPITDTFYRVNVVVSGTGPSFLFVVTMGIY